MEPRKANSYHFTSFGRTGDWFALERYGVEPNILAFAKGITSGYLPLDGIMFSRPILDAMTSVPYADRWMHAYTHSGHPTCCVVGLRNLEILEKEGLVENAAKMGARLLAGTTTLSDLKAGRDLAPGAAARDQRVRSRPDRRYPPGGDCNRAAGAGVIGRTGALTEVVVRHFSGSETRKGAIGTNWGLAGQTSGV